MTKKSENYRSDFVAFAKDVLGFDFTEAQINFLRHLASGWTDGKQVVHLEWPGRAAGKTATIQAVGKYLQRGLEKHPHQELSCELCHRDYPVWYAPNDLWNKVMRAPDDREASEKHAFVCPTCFAMEAERQGVNGTAWVLNIEQKKDQAQL